MTLEAHSALSFEKRNLGKKLVDARSNLIDMHLIQYLKNEFCFDLPMFSKYPATSINSYFYKTTLLPKYMRALQTEQDFNKS